MGEAMVPALPVSVLKFLVEMTARASSTEYTTRVMPSAQRMTRPVRTSLANLATSSVCAENFSKAWRQTSVGRG